MAKLTPEQKKAYLADSSKCPYCGAVGVEGGEVDCQGDNHYQNIVCTTCGKEWVDIYTLTDVDDAESNDDTSEDDVRDELAE